jgi:hypothetical protein
VIAFAPLTINPSSQPARHAASFDVSPFVALLQVGDREPGDENFSTAFGIRDSFQFQYAREFVMRVQRARAKRSEATLAR